MLTVHFIDGHGNKIVPRRKRDKCDI